MLERASLSHVNLDVSVLTMVVDPKLGTEAMTGRGSESEVTSGGQQHLVAAEMTSVGTEVSVSVQVGPAGA